MRCKIVIGDKDTTALGGAGGDPLNTSARWNDSSCPFTVTLPSSLSQDQFQLHLILASSCLTTTASFSLNTLILENYVNVRINF